MNIKRKEDNKVSHLNPDVFIFVENNDSIDDTDEHNNKQLYDKYGQKNEKVIDVISETKYIENKLIP